MEVKPGYKQTEVGVIPEEWLVSTLGNVCVFENGDRSSNYPSPGSFVSSGIPFINAGHIAEGKINSEGMNFIAPECYARLGGGKVKSGDILFCLRGSLGKYGVVRDNFGEGAIASSLVIVRSKSAAVTLNYLCHYFNSALCKQMIDTWSGGAAQPNLGAQDLAKFLVPLPATQAEQRAIDAVLSDVDALLASLDRLIAKKRDMKQAAMQELLTGKRRLPGFSGEWEFVSLSSISKEPMQNGVFYKPSLKGSGVKLINVGDLYACTPIDSDSLELFNATPSERERFKVEDGDLFFTRSSVVPSGIAHCNMYCAHVSEHVVFDSHVIRFRPDTKRVFPPFLFRYCIGTNARHYLVSHAKTATMTTIDQGVLGKCPVHLPSLPEQTAIAAILSDMDTEIAALEQKRDKTRLLKQGMMQELLTGKIRLV